MGRPSLAPHARRPRAGLSAILLLLTTASCDGPGGAADDAPGARVDAPSSETDAALDGATTGLDVGDAPGPSGGLYGYCDDVADQPGGRWNSCEPGCDGSNADYLYCDDFEDGQWAATDGDGYFMGERAYLGDPYDNPDNDGWALTIYVPSEHQFGAAYGRNPAEVPGRAYARCDGAGVGRSDCAATSTYNDTTSKMMGTREFPDDACHDEVFIRYYIRPSADYVFGHEKSWVSFQDERRAGIWTGNFHYPFGSAELAWQPQGDQETWRYQNVGEHAATRPGEWNFIEIHYRLNTPGVADGTIELWADPCGPDGTTCRGTPTLRMRHTDVMMRAAGDTGRVCSLWYENWSNTPSVGEMFYDQLIVATAGPIGYCDSCLE